MTDTKMTSRLELEAEEVAKWYEERYWAPVEKKNVIHNRFY
jgi:hypothetical protein